MGAFKSDMSIDQFIAIVQANKSMGDALPRAYERAERVHEAPEICGKRRFNDFEAFEQRFYQVLRRRRLGIAQRLGAQRGKPRKVAKKHSD